jgi:hypothetical protein
VSGLRVLFLIAFWVSVSVGVCQPVDADVTTHSPDDTTRSPHGDKLKIPCQECHTAQAWKPLRAKLEFKHSETRFPLRGRHTEAECSDCHVDPNFSNVRSKCQDCHADLHRRKNGAECQLCHNPNGWEVSLHNIYNEHLDRFPLIGAHAAVDCYACHKVGTVGEFNRFGLSTQCVSCHQDMYLKAKSPNHVALGYSLECQQCHISMDTWYRAVLSNGNLRK